MKRQRSDDYDEDRPVNPPPVTVHAQPRPLILTPRGQRVERAIGYKPEYRIRTSRDD